MSYLLRSAAVAMATSAFAFAAHAQDNSAGSQQQTASAPSYCDTQWVEVDGNEDGFVSREEASAAIANEFDRIDLDGNGEITKTEWVDCRTRMGSLTAVEADRSADNFAQADADQDQSMSREEFRDASQQAYEQSRSATDAGAEPMIVLRRFVFLTPGESQDTSMLQSMSEDEAAARSERTFQALDQNGDGIVDTQEWSEKSPVSGPSQEQASRSFDEIDADGSNAITEEEYQQARQDMVDATTTGSVQDGSSEDGSQQGEAVGVRPFAYYFWY